MDSKYEDGKMAIIEIKEILDIGAGSEWTNDNHKITLTTVWR